MAKGSLILVLMMLQTVQKIAIMKQEFFGVFTTPKCPIFQMEILLQKYIFVGVVEQYNFAR